ncbi:hypothetical protein LCGC14_1006140 [marine sediment metagenome]|uniref:Uncharacterized protein n=1 Tax=marine sediment metagenome TaxID=412755 RepID=A0A0F9N681_9ZZZZ
MIEEGPGDLTDEELSDLWNKLNREMAQLNQKPVLHRPKREEDLIEQYHAVSKERDGRARVPLY